MCEPTQTNSTFEWGRGRSFRLRLHFGLRQRGAVLRTGVLCGAEAPLFYRASRCEGKIGLGVDRLSHPSLRSGWGTLIFAARRKFKSRSFDSVRHGALRSG